MAVRIGSVYIIVGGLKFDPDLALSPCSAVSCLD